MESIQVEIFGQTYSIKVANNRDYIQELAIFVDMRMKEVQKSTGTSDVYRIAILTALNITDELHRLRSQHNELKQTASSSLDHLIEITDGVERK
jgi:cell division protein ZapA (FtsZ GTPase activity inhibitor)